MIQYAAATWVKDGMDWPMVNCWGLVRYVMCCRYGRTIPRLDFDGTDKRKATKATAYALAGMSKGAIRDGAIAVAWHGAVCYHVGIVITVNGALRILDINEGVGAATSKPAAFERQYTRVEYYA